MSFRVVGDFRQLDAWIKKLENGCSRAAIDTVSSMALKELAKEFIDVVKGKTPVGVVPYKVHPQHDKWVNDNPGELKEAWDNDNAVLKVVRANGKYTLTLQNNTKYASYIEYGHSQHVGQYVWWIEGRLRRSSVQGKFFMTLTEKEIQDNDTQIIQRIVETWLKEVVGT